MIRLVHETLAMSAADRPGAIALVCEGRQVTYAELTTMALRLAGAFARAGIGRGDRVVVFLPNGIAAVVGIFGASISGAAFVVVDGNAHPETARRIVEDCQPAALVTGGPHVPFAVELLRSLPSLQRVVLSDWSDTGADPRLLSLESILSTATPLPALPAHDEDDLAYLIYTSGSTGVPKGVMITHRSALFAIQIDIDFLGLTSDDVILDALQLSFGYGFHQLLKSARLGAKLVLEKSFAFPAEILSRMAAERVTVLPGLPTMFSLLLRQDVDTCELPSLRLLTSMGAPLAPSLIHALRIRFPRAQLFSMYSLTEACNALGLDPAELERRADSVGKPLPGTEAWIANDDGQPVGPEGVGELVIAGGHVRTGYWNDPSLTQQRFRRGRFPGETVCHTGDLFRKDDEGFFYFMGRKDEMIKTAGRKVWPRQIEDVLHAMPGILEAAVVGLPDPTWGHVICAFVALDSSAALPLTERDILRHCSQHLDAYMVPRRVELVPRLPRTASGKLRKSDLASAAASR